MCVFSFGSRFADFGRYVIDRQKALHRIFWSKTSFSFRTVASSHCAIHRLRRSLAALLLSLPLLFGLTVPDDAYAQTCNVSTAITDAEGAFGHHRQGGKGLPVATATYRALIALGDTSLPTWSGSNISGAAPTTPISEAGLRAVLTSQNELGSNHWAGWTRILTALNCLEAALPAVTIAAVGAVVTEGAGAQFTVSVNPAQSSALTVNLNITDSAGSDFVASGNEGDKTIVIPANANSAVHIVPTENDNNDEAHGDVTVTVAGGSGYKLGSSSTAMVTVNDNDEPSAADQVQMKNATRKVAEFGNDKGDARGLRVVVEIGDEASLNGSPRTIKYTIDDDSTATRGNDADDPKDYYIDGCTSSTCSVKLPANRHSAVITIYVNNDGLDEGDETIILTLTSGNGYTLPPVNKRTTTVKINDDDTRGLTFHRTWPDVPEGESQNEGYTVRLASEPTAAVTVNIASNNPDVTVNPASLTFTPSNWKTTQKVMVSAAQDNDAVDDEAILTYTTSGGDYGGANALSIDRTVRVDDDDTADPITSNLPRISLTGGADVTEGTAATFTVNADRAPTSSLTINVEVTEPPGQDFVAASEEGVKTVTLNAAATSATFTVLTVNDSTDEADGVVQVFVNDGTGYIADQGAAVNVNDNDGTGPPTTPAASFASASSSAAENDGTRNVTVNLSASAPLGGLTLNYSVSGTATAGSGNDFTIQNSGTLTIAAGANFATIPVAINDDSATESAETVILTLTGGTGYTVGSPSVHTLTITDNDNTTPTTPSLTLNPTEIGAGSLDGATITLTPVNASFFGASGSGDGGRGGESNIDPRTYVNSNDLVGNEIPHSAVRLSALGLGKITLSGAPAGLTIASGRLLARQSQQGGFVHGLAAHRSVEITLAYSGSSIGADDPVTVNVDGDALRLVDGNSRQDLSDISADFTVKAGEVPPAASFGSASSSADEDAGTHNVTVDISPAPSGGLTLSYSITGTAGSGNDFTIQNSGTVSIAAGGTSATIAVTINDDNAAENAETVILTLTGGAGYTVGNPSVHTLTISDNDSTSASFASSASSANEDAGTRNVTVNLSSAAPSGGLTLSYSVTGTAGSGNDFTIQNSGTVAVAAGATSASIPIAINDDSTEENDETVILTLTSGTGYTLGSTTVHTLTITDNETPQPPGTPALQLSSNTLSVSEGGTGSYTVRLATAPTGTGTVIVNIASGNPDVTVNPSSLTFNNSTSLWSTPQTVTVSALQDADTINDSATLTHTASGGGYGSVTGLVTVTVNDDDAPVVSFDSQALTIEEAGSTHLVQVDLSLVAPMGGLTLGYRVTGTATPGSDFTIENSGTLSVAPRATTATIPVVISDDNTPENAETVILTLTGGTGYTLGTTTVHTLTITNDDGHEVSFTAAEDRIPEGREHTVAVRIFPVSDNLTNVSYTISGTATAEEDYEDLPVMVEVPAGESQAVIRIETIADKEDDSGETVVLTLDQPTDQGLTLGTPSVHTLTILDSKEAIVEAGRSWLVRFGRSVAEQIVDSISQRLRATRTEGTQVNVAGAQVPIGQSRAFGTFEPPTTNRPIDDFDTHSQTSAPGSTQTLSEREVIQSSSFMSVSESDAQGGSFAVWGRAAHSSFEGREDKLSLDGDSTSVMLGADYAQQYWQAGATVIQSEGKGEYRDEVISGDAEASITSIVPWAAVQATERVQLWGALGTGDGDLELTEEDSDALKTNIDWSMAAAGLRSVLVPASGQNGLQLSLVGDALWVETRADPIEGLSFADAQASRLRLGLEGEYASELASGAEMISRLEFGIREDSGDAETGGGIEIGGGVAWRDASSGLKIELAGRKLLSYDNDELEDEGFSLSFDYDPAPNTEEGLSVSLHQEIGVRSKGGLEALFDSEPLATRTDGEKENRVRLEAAYGVPVLGGRFIGSPHMGLGLATGSREYSLGWKVTPERHAPDLSFGVRATRTESDALVPAHTIRFETVFRW